MITPTQKKLDGVQILRAGAALCVLLQHALFISALTTHMGIAESVNHAFGGNSVNLLFFISGFMMMLQLNKPAYAFALHRIVRVYPPFFLSIILSILISMPVLGWHYYRFHFGLDFLLLPTGKVNPTFNVPYWTLIYEVFFYTLIFIVIFLKVRTKTLNFLLLFWTVVVLLAAQFHPITNYAMPKITQIGLSPVCIFLIIGAACGLFYLKKSEILAWLLGLLSIFYFITPNNSVTGQIPNLFIFLLIFYLAVKFDDISLNKFFTKIKHFLVNCGDYSYGLYLLHLTIIATVCYNKHFMQLQHWQLFILSSTIAIIGGLIYGYVEFTLYSKKFRPFASKLAAAISKKLSARAQAAKNDETPQSNQI